MGKLPSSFVSEKMATVYFSPVLCDYNLGQDIIEKYTKSRETGFSMENFRPFFRARATITQNFHV